MVVFDTYVDKEGDDDQMCVGHGLLLVDIDIFFTFYCCLFVLVPIYGSLLCHNIHVNSIFLLVHVTGFLFDILLLLRNLLIYL